MKHRYAIAALVAAGLSAAAWFGWRASRAPAAHAGPIVLISIDTLRADRLPIYGYRKVATPAIDALAADSVVFDQAWAHTPLTLPSHASILTGRLPFEHGVRDNMGFTLKDGSPTLASLLAGRGYATGGFISAYVLRRQTGIARGFDTYDDALPATSPEKATGEVQRDGSETLAAAEAWLTGRTDPKWFLFLHLYEPHSPYEPPDRFRRFGDAYDGEVAYSDEIVGRLIDTLKRRGDYGQALIILLSDHGEGLGDHGEMEHGIFLYSETTKVPLVVKLPGGRLAGRRVAQPVQHIDIFPTIAAEVGAPAPPGLRGRSLAPIFGGGSVADAGLYAEALYPRYHFGWSELYALTDARYRFIRAPRDELYDIQEDPAERRSVAAERESTRVAMRQALEALMSGASVDTPQPVPPEAREQLKALGYVGMQSTVSPQTSGDALPDPKDKIGVLERYRQGLDLVRGNRLPEATRAFQAIVAENPAMADVWGEIAGLLVRQGRLEEALAAYKTLVEVAPYDPAAIISVVQVLVELGRYDEARSQAELALKLLPAGEARWRATAHKMLMRVALARGDAAAARSEAALAEREDASFPLVDYVEGLLRYNAGQYAEALPFFEAAIRKSASRTFQIPELHYHLGDTLGRLERYAEAERAFVEELRLFPSSLRASAGLAMLYRAQGRVADSNRAIEVMIRRSPTVAGFTMAADLFNMFGEPGRAAAMRDQARKAGAGASSTR
jgi:arylsulfatase A-like enzyme/Flp pilus assembly protein TadD